MEKKNTHIIYGFVTGVVMVIINMIIYLLGAAFKPGMQYISYIPLLTGIILCAMAFSKANDGYVTFGNVFGSCLKASMIITIVLLTWSILSMYIFPEMKEKAMSVAREKMAENPKMTDEQMDMGMNMMKKYWNVFLIGGVVFGTMIVGALFSVIGGAVAQKKGENPFKPGTPM